MSRKQILDRRTIEALIADGRSIVIFEGKVLRLDGWLDKHPGGKLAVMHMVGRDASDEMNVYHSADTLRRVSAYQIGRIDESSWLNFTPPIRGGLFRKAVVDQEQDSEQDDTEGSSIDSKLGSLNSSATSLDILVDGQTEGFKKHVDTQILNAVATTTEGLTHRRIPSRKNEETSDRSSTSSDSKMTRDAYTAQVIQEEVDECIRDYPSLDAETQEAIRSKYHSLHERVKNEGYYDCRYIEYGKEAIRYSILFGLFIFTLRAGWYLTSSCFLGIFWHQIMFTAHDAGHRGITHNFVIDTLIGMFIADFTCGLSIGWWKSSHNVHHLITNHPEHDPDIQNVPLFATCPEFFKSINSSYYDGFVFAWDKACDILVPYQKYMYYPVMALARFNLYVLSWLHLLSPRSVNLGAARWTRPTEIVFMACYWYWFGYLLCYRTLPTWTTRVLFVLLSHMITFPLHVQICLSHWGMPTADLGEAESFPQRQLRTTMDVSCPAWFDFVHGGLQFQAVHHLFPRVPRHNLRKLSMLVRQFCSETGIEYKILGFTDGNKKVLGKLEQVSRQVDILVQCSNSLVESGEMGLH